MIAPKRVATIVWPAEIKAWEHTKDLRYAVLDGSPAQRLELLYRGNQQITIIGIDNVQWLVKLIAKWDADYHMFDCLVIDEMSRLKDPKSKRGAALAKVAGRFKNRWGLTGTPMPNSLMDLFTPMKIITNGRYGGSRFTNGGSDHFYAD